MQERHQILYPYLRVSEYYHADKYRLEKTEERDIQLMNKNAEIEPVPTSTATGVDEPDMVRLSIIESRFNELFGNIDWSNDDLVKAQVEEITQKVADDDTVRNSMLNSDEDTANQDCDNSVSGQMAIMTATHTELMKAYWTREDFRESLNQMIREKVRNSINPPYDEDLLKHKIRKEFRDDFIDFCDGEHNVSYDEVINVFFKIINVDTIPDLQGLRKILRHILNCLYRAQHREEDYRTWYAELVSRFEAFLKKIYWIKNAVPVPLTADGRQPAFIDTVRHFSRVESLYSTRDPKFKSFKQFYNVVYSWRNNENHRAVEMSSELLPVALHAAVALYLYTSMVCAKDIETKI